MHELEQLKDKLKDLKLEKRRLLLSGKSTEDVDIKIKDVEERIRKEGSD